MGYHIAVDGRINIDPPIVPTEIMSAGDALKPLLPEMPGLGRGEHLVFVLSFPLGIGSAYVAIRPRQDEIIEEERTELVAHLNSVLDALTPGHTFTGCFELDGEDPEDISRIVIRNGRAVEESATVIWASDESTSDQPPADGPPWLALPVAEVRALFYVAIGSAGFADSVWGWGKDETDVARTIAVRLDLDPMEATPRHMARHYPHPYTQWPADTLHAQRGAQCRWCDLGPRTTAHVAHEEASK